MTKVDWSKLPDLIAVGLLSGAFASVARKSPTPVSNHWLVGWLLIVFHFAASMIQPLGGHVGQMANFVGIMALVGAALLFTRSAVPYRHIRASVLMLFMLIATYLLYVACLIYEAPRGVLVVSAILLGAGPAVVGLLSIKLVNHPLRWFLVSLQCALAAALLNLQDRPGIGPELALNALLFTAYFATAVHFWYVYRRISAGGLITIAGFFLWANVFTISPALEAWYPGIHLESEVWNLPKYVVAVGMILLLLEDQIAHNKFLALHDELTGLPNRRLFQDRLSSALERARRSGMQAALLMIDLDDFKQVNDTLGHHTGDMLLQEVARLFSGRIRRVDTVARTGGDEFAVILDGPTSRSEATQVGQSLLEMLDKPLVLGDSPVEIAASLGVAIFPEDADDLESLCIEADLRMYQDKRNSSGRIRAFKSRGSLRPKHSH